MGRGRMSPVPILSFTNAVNICRPSIFLKHCLQRTQLVDFSFTFQNFPPASSLGAGNNHRTTEFQS